MPEKNIAFYDYVRKANSVLNRMDHYRLLGIKKDATSEQVFAATAKVIPMYDPKRYQDAPADVIQGLHKIYALLYRAARTLTNPKSREAYDSLHASRRAVTNTRLRQSIVPEKPENSIKSRSARQFYLKSIQNLDEGDFQQARLHITMANNQAPDTFVITELAERIEQRYKQIKALSGTGQTRIATGKNPTMRMAVEHTYGSAVWESLLRNKEITEKEVARIASHKNITSQLIENIINNPDWLGFASVQEALLKNPKLKTSLIQVVLDNVSPVERRRISTIPTYPTKVRKAACANI